MKLKTHYDQLEALIEADALMWQAADILKKAAGKYKDAGSSYAEPCCRSARQLCYSTLRLGQDWKQGREKLLKEAKP